MKNQRYKGLFEDWEVGVAINVIERFRRDWACLRAEEFEDLIQECLIHWHFVRSKYNPSAGASIQTFMARTTENQILNIIRDLHRNKRKVFQKRVSLDEPLSDDDDSPTLLETLRQDESAFKDPRFKFGLREDISQTLEKLTPRQKELCRFLSDPENSITDISKQLGIGRKLIYTEIRRIRAVFENQGLKNYLV